MKVLITGAKGFIGKHLVKRLQRENIEVLSFDTDNTDTDLVNFVSKADFIVHLAGVMRPLTTDEFYLSNSNLTEKLVSIVKASGRQIPVLLASSTQAVLDNDYGKTKKMCEDFLFTSNLPVYVFRFTNAFGKWGKPNYNSVASTFMYNIAHNQNIYIRDSNFIVHFIYIDDIVDTILRCIKGNIKPSKEILYVEPVHDCSLGKLAELLSYFKKSVESNEHLPIIQNDFEFKLFTSFMDYLSDEGSTFNYISDDRGSFEEIYKSKEFGQISINVVKPGAIKGGHYHTYKNEIFMTVKGMCITRIRNIYTKNVQIFNQNVENSLKVEIKPFYTHDIKNIGANDAIILMWISETYNVETSDTIQEKVVK